MKRTWDHGQFIGVDAFGSMIRSIASAAAAAAAAARSHADNGVKAGITKMLGFEILLHIHGNGEQVCAFWLVLWILLVWR